MGRITSSDSRALAGRYAGLRPLAGWFAFACGVVAIVAVLLGIGGYPPDAVHSDALNYWGDQPYSDPEYRYSPAFYWVTLPLRALPFEIFVSVWGALHVAAVLWLGPWTILLAFDDIVRGNINTFLAVGVVLAVRGQAWTWAGPLLTKVTPGIGLLHHAGRRDWRAVLVAIGTTVVMVAVTWPLGLWPEWVDSLRASYANYPTVGLLPLPLELALAGVLCLASARWLWLLPVGILIAMPGMQPANIAILAAWPRIRANLSAQPPDPTSPAPLRRAHARD